MIWIYWALGMTVTVLASAACVRRARRYGLVVLSGALTAYVLSANILAPRIAEVDFAVATATLATGSLIWPFTAQISDMINEIYGRVSAYVAVIVAYTMNGLFVLFVLMAHGARPTWTSTQETSWWGYFAPATRVFAASGGAFIVGELVDVAVFARLKAWAYARGETDSLGSMTALSAARSALSGFADMALDAVFFTTFAFWGALPPAEFRSVLVSSVLVKAGLAVGMTPWFVSFRLATRGVRRDS